MRSKLCLSILALAIALLAALAQTLAQNTTDDALELKTRRRAPADGAFKVEEGLAKWSPKKTAIIVCDMWDKHWCKSATDRVLELAPRMNEVLKHARQRGVLIIHAPSDTMKFYEGAPQRKKAQAAPKAVPPKEVSNWMALNLEKEGPLPIDDTDGGCDDEPQCKNFRAWSRQIDILDVAPEDFVSADGAEIYNILQQHGIENVIIMGVHTNMCVLGRPFSIRQMVALGKNVLLMRDMTDSMYNPRKKPFVSHFAGTDLVIEHIEKHWCPTTTSDQLIGGKPFKFKQDARSNSTTPAL